MKKSIVIVFALIMFSSCDNILKKENPYVFPKFNSERNTFNEEIKSETKAKNVSFGVSSMNNDSITILTINVKEPKFNFYNDSLLRIKGIKLFSISQKEISNLEIYDSLYFHFEKSDHKKFVERQEIAILKYPIQRK
ncbi:hypothetical protein BST86_05660 [Nonlabens agnitus]|uniref:Uncharacterized protein n=1 Tax=Nonlabens agnitus TaxID=870484 RepID=A0A2S9WT10_9FLAO|nr:hypothetical protein BST86_05660 [Nonlabens agnitus]